VWRRELDLNRRDPFTSRLLRYIGIFFFLEMTGVADAGTNPIRPGRVSSEFADAGSAFS
jgi:hypothetical protein